MFGHNVGMFHRIQMLLALMMLIGIHIESRASEPSMNRDAIMDSLDKLFKKGDFDGTIAAANKAIEASPLNQDDVIEKSKTIRAYIYRGMAWRQKGNADKCLADCEVCVQLGPVDQNQANSVANLLGMAHSDKGNYAGALTYHEYLVQANPDDASYYGQLASTCKKLNQYEKAVNAFRGAIERAPKNPEFYNALAWLLATCPDGTARNGKAAVKNATTACELVEYKNWSYMDTLSVACAEAGDFENAAVWISGAIEIALEKKARPKVIEDLRTRSTLFERRMPYHEATRPNTPPPSNPPVPSGGSAVPPAPAPPRGAPAPPPGASSSSGTPSVLPRSTLPPFDGKPAFDCVVAGAAGMFAPDLKSMIVLDSNDFVGLRDNNSLAILWKFQVAPLPGRCVLATYINDTSLLVVSKADTRRVDGRTGKEVWRADSQIEATSLRTLAINGSDVVILKDSQGKETTIDLGTGRVLI